MAFARSLTEPVIGLVLCPCARYAARLVLCEQHADLIFRLRIASLGAAHQFAAAGSCRCGWLRCVLGCIGRGRRRCVRYRRCRILSRQGYRACGRRRIRMHRRRPDRSRRGDIFPFVRSQCVIVFGCRGFRFRCCCGHGGDRRSLSALRGGRCRCRWSRSRGRLLVLLCGGFVPIMKHGLKQYLALGGIRRAKRCGAADRDSQHHAREEGGNRSLGSQMISHAQS